MLPGRQYSPEELLRLLWYRKWIVLVAVVICTGTALVTASRITNMYRSETLIMVIPQRVPESYVRSTVTMRIEDRLRSISEQIRSRSGLEKVIDDFGLYAEMRKTRPMEEIVAVMRTNISIDTVRDDAFTVSFVAPSPRTAMIVTDRLAGMFIDQNATDRKSVGRGINEFLESNLRDARIQLEEHEKKLEEFRRKYSGELPQQLETNLQGLRNTQAEIQSLNESIDRDRDRRLTLERSAGDTAVAGTASDTPPAGTAAVEKISDQLERGRAELSALRLRLKPEHPDVIAKVKAVAELERRAQAESAAEVQGLPTKGSDAEQLRQARVRGYQAEIAKLDKQMAQKEADIARLRQVAGDYQRRVNSVPGHESEQTALMRDYETLQKAYTSLLAKKQDSKISSNLEEQQVAEQFKVLDPARLPEEPYYPNRTRLTLIGLAIGLALGFGIAGFIEYRDTTLRTEDEIIKMLVLPVVAAIPVMTAVADSRRNRRNLILFGGISLVVVCGTMAGVLWRLGFLTRLP